MLKGEQRERREGEGRLMDAPRPIKTYLADS